jgi:hypothetical protein
MDNCEEIGNLPQPELGKFGEYLAKKYWSENKFDVVSCHRNEIDFYVNEIPYDVKTTAVALRKREKYDNKPPKYFGQHKDGVCVLRVAIYTDCAVLACDGECLQLLDRNELSVCWSESHSKKGGALNRVTPRYELGNWLAQQKQLVREICEFHKLHVRVMYRNGVTVQTKFGKWGPNSLIPTDPNKEDLTVFLWTEGDSIHRVIAFLHSEINKMPLYKHIPPNKAPVQTMPLMDFEQFHGKWCFISLDDFKNNFRFSIKPIIRHAQDLGK